MMPLHDREEAGQDGDEQLAGQIVAGAPHTLEERHELAAVAPRAPGRRPGRARPLAQPPDRRLPVAVRRSTVVVPNPPSFTLGGHHVPPLQHLDILSARSLRHGAFRETFF
jgi:hypothetical protein